MDKNTGIGLLLIVAIFIGFSYYSSKNQKGVDQARQVQDSLAIAQAPQSTQSEVKSQPSVGEAVNQSVADSTVADSTRLKENYGTFANVAKGKQEFITLENSLLKLTISTRGGRPYSVEVKEYKTYSGKPLILFNGDSTVFGLKFFANNRTIFTNDLYFNEINNATNVILTESDTLKSVTMRLAVGENKYIEYVYSIRPNSYLVDFDMRLQGLKDVISSNTNTIDLQWAIFVPQQEKGRKNEQQYTNIDYKYANDEVENLSSQSKPGEEVENISTRVEWVAFKQQFFSSVLVTDNYFSNTSLKSNYLAETDTFLRKFTCEVGIPYDLSKNQSVNMSFYFGPNHYQTLKKAGHGLENLVQVGKNIIKWINKICIIPVFNFLNNYIVNYGLIILILTLLLKLVLFPLTYKSYLSQAKMRVLKPQIDEINKRFPKEKALEAQQAVMALYKKVGVSPMGGCLPMLLQFPILIAMYRFFPTSIELRQQPFLWATDLSTYDTILSWSQNIPIVNFLFHGHISLFCILMTASTVISMWMSNQTTATPQMPGMKTMMYIMPVMFLFIMNDFSSGLTYYYFLANLFTIAQNEVFKRSINEEKLLHKLNENKKKVVEKSNFQKRLEAAAKARGVKLK
jgi:YidC/Oxa1 family membrane protein insertase